MSYDAYDLSVKAHSHPEQSRYAALVACAQALVASARRGIVRGEWVLPFVRGVLKFDNTHGHALLPLDLLVWCSQHPAPPERLFAFAMNLVDPPSARMPDEVPANHAVCLRFLLTIAREPVSYFDP